MVDLPNGEDEAVRYAQGLASLRRVGRSLRRRIEEDAKLSVRKALVAQADPLMRALLIATLSPESYEIFEAGTAREALEMLRAHQPSLVLIDAAFPDGSGLDVCRQIRGDPDLSNVVVVVLSISSTDAARDAALAAGADAHVAKPFSPLILLKTIEELLC